MKGWPLMKLPRREFLHLACCLLPRNSSKRPAALNNKQLLLVEQDRPRLANRLTPDPRSLLCMSSTAEVPT